MFARCCCVEERASDVEQARFDTHLQDMPPELVKLRAEAMHKGVNLPGTQRTAESLKPDADRATLNVPIDFSVRSMESASSMESGYVSLTEDQKAREMAKLQSMIKDFVKEVLRGVYLDVVLEDGTLMSCRCTMDNKLSTVSLQVRDSVRHVCLTNIQEICSGKELRNIRTTTPLDELCVTLVMSNDQCVSFKFKDVQAREHFATCMKVLRLALE
mmetsp:Transcript_40974/g.107627  ORF Transcript_40974/g.107627 Transcript_40974/m.107627 type:complete len:215 (+) Transcript_40974:84-728(+)